MKKLFSLALALTLCSSLFAQLPCDCDFNPNEPFVCAQDADGNTLELPNACFAECLGFTLVEDGCDGGGTDPWDDCGCEYDPSEPFICAQDADGHIFEVPNACFVECLDLTVVEDGCDGGNPGSCDCEIDPNEPYVCAMDFDGSLIYVPNACFAECLGMTLAEGCDSGSGNDCGCEYDPSQPFVCALDEYGDLIQVPNACFAECWGYTVVEDTCGMDVVLTFEMFECVNGILAQEPELLQTFLLALYNECNVPLGDCIINAPLFETDEAFEEYVMACIGDNFQDEGAGLQFFNAFLGANSSSPTSTGEAPTATNTAALLQNPVTDLLSYRITAPTNGRMVAKVTNMNGQVLQSASFVHQAGINDLSLSIGGLPSGMYLLSLVGDRGLISLKFIKN